MRRRFFFPFFSLCSLVALETVASEKSLEKNQFLQNAVSEGDFKRAIDIQLKKIQEAPVEKADEYKELALLYLKDQDQERAFETFLKALALIPSGTAPLIFDEVEYNKAFSLYLNPQGESIQKSAKQLIKALKPVLQEKSDQYILNYFLAMAYANLGHYEDFFKHFYIAYEFYPNHYLSYKTRAVLHIKLLERVRGDIERAAQRRMIVDYLLSALQREALDTTIYKLLISFSPKEMKHSQVQRCLNKIIDDNIMIPRSELMFYATEAIDIHDTELAQKFIDRAKKWYPQSRILTTAQNYLDAHK